MYVRPIVKLQMPEIDEETLKIIKIVLFLTHDIKWPLNDGDTKNIFMYNMEWNENEEDRGKKNVIL